MLSHVARIIELISEVAARTELLGSRVLAWRFWKPLTKRSYKWSIKLNPETSKAEIMSFDGNPLNYYLFIRAFENSVEKCTEDYSLRLQLLIQYCTGKQRKRLSAVE